MSTITLPENVQEMSAAQLAEHIRALQGLKKSAEALENERLGGLLQDLVEDVVTSGDPTRSEKSAWVGYSRNAVPVEVDGTKYMVSVTITDVAAKEARKDEFPTKAEKAASDLANAAIAAASEEV